MKIHIFSIGRMKPGPLLDLCNEYEKRLSWPTQIKEVSFSPQESILHFKKTTPSQGKQIFLNEKGVQFTSPGFAQQIDQWVLQGYSQLSFFIGGAEGYDPSLLEPRDFRLSLGQATWPHLLTRVLLLEQLYRAQQILAGHPYHK